MEISSGVCVGDGDATGLVAIEISIFSQTNFMKRRKG